MNRIQKYFGIWVLIAVLSACEKTNDWSVDPSQNGLFRSLTFETSNVYDTSVEIRYNKIIDAEYYIFDFYEDSLAFTHPSHSVKILADTVSEYAGSDNPSRTEYRTLFDNLKGLTAYSVRMHGVSEELGLKSGYTELYFQTPSEQLFRSTTSGLDFVMVSWTPGEAVTQLAMTYNEDGVEQRVEHQLSSDEIAQGAFTFDNLNPGKSYTFVIFNEDNQRGNTSTKTLGLDGAVIVDGNNGGLSELLTTAVENGDTSVIVSISQDAEIGGFDIPLGIKNVSLTGIPSSEGTKPKVKLGQMNFPEDGGVFSSVIIENLDVTGDGYAFRHTKDGLTVGTIAFRSCIISAYNSWGRFENGVYINLYRIEDCIVLDNGTANYGALYTNKSCQLARFELVNSTVLNIKNQLLDFRVDGTTITITNCTFANINAQIKSLIALRNATMATVITTENNIITGTNNDNKWNATSWDANSEQPFCLWESSYQTTDVLERPENENRIFWAIQNYNGTMDGLFVNPTDDINTMDWGIKEEAGFAGTGTAGDPRWF